jgi:uncharacterized protein (TIGR00369 family)
MGSFLDDLKKAAQGTFWEHLGCRLVAADAGKASVELDVQKQHLNGIGILHGGVHASLLDNTMGLAAMSLAQSPQVVTMNLQIHFTAPLEVGKVTVTAEAMHRSIRTIIVIGRLLDEQGRLGSMATGSFRILDVSGRTGNQASN